MKCTSCSAEVKPIVALDIDGTLGKYHQHFLSFAEYYLGKRLPKQWDGKGDWEDYLGLDRKTYQEVKLAFRQGGMKRTMPVFSEAAALCNTVRAMDAELWLTTTRPYNRLDSVDPDTREWLRRHKIKYDHLLYDEYKYERLAELVDQQRVCMVLEDLPSHCLVAEKTFSFATVVLRLGKHNEYAAKKFMSVNDLHQATQVAVRSIKEWKEHYG